MVLVRGGSRFEVNSNINRNFSSESVNFFVRYQLTKFLAQTDRETHRHTDTQTDTQTGRQTDTQTDAHTDRQIQTDTQTDTPLQTHTHTRQAKNHFSWRSSVSRVRKCA